MYRRFMYLTSETLKLLRKSCFCIEKNYQRILRAFENLEQHVIHGLSEVSQWRRKEESNKS